MDLFQKFPYVGITGFTRRFEVETCIRSFPLMWRKRDLAAWKLMVGVLANYETLKGHEHASKPNRYPTKHSDTNSMSRIFLANPWVYNIVHYNTSCPSALYAQLRLIHWVVGENIDGIQLNLVWPDVDEIEKYKEDAGRDIILQVGAEAMKTLENDPLLIAKAIKFYAPCINHVLIDPSGGKGQPFNPERIRPIISEVYSLGCDIGVGVAGGFGPGRMQHLEPLIQEFPDLNVDVEKGVRTPEDNLDLDACTLYMSGVNQMLQETKK